MERMTREHWRNDDPWELCGLGDDCKRRCVNSREWCKVALQIRRLAQYEDTKLTPAQVNKILVTVLPEL